MEQSLIPVFQANDQQLLCNARDLHEFLEVGRRFTTWIQGRIDEYGFVEGEDFTVITDLRLPDPGVSKARVQEATEYHLTLDMAKELAMIENNAMGRRVRRYFIQRERQAIELLQQQADSVRPLEEVRAEIGDTPKFRYLLILQEQSRSCARQLDQAQGPHERYTLHCQLRQINNVIGIPTQPLVKQDEVDMLASAHKGSATSTHKLEN
ncbi:antA/AntB antirepressor family protein [Vreelandella titanicae]|uniref:antA/AntB antirepressor family protein n=1 Tax=Vreelandella titanicae TaxID=664683 RepID=UPI003D04D5E8|tara:strand:+ start:629 stop:1255 length:627 start_codon:yes stop_codon:yes gene_type:complete